MITISLLLFTLFPSGPAIAKGRLNLPQSKETVTLAEGPRRALGIALARHTTAAGYALETEAAAPFLEGLPNSFRDSCSEVIGTWGGDARQTAQWTVRVLFSHRTSGGTEALLALRCGSTLPDFERVYDERLAAVSFAGDGATLRFLPMAEDCINCADFLHFEFSQSLTAAGASLLELEVYESSNDSPCCGGGEQQSETQLVLFALPEWKQVLFLDKMSEDNFDDDSAEDGGSNLVCRAKSTYLRGPAGNVMRIQNRIQCSENGKPRPEIKREFRWNASTRAFDEAEPKP